MKASQKPGPVRHLKRAVRPDGTAYMEVVRDAPVQRRKACAQPFPMRETPWYPSLEVPMNVDATRKPLPTKPQGKAKPRMTFETAAVLYLQREDYLSEVEFVEQFAAAKRRGLCSMTLTQINTALDRS